MESENKSRVSRVQRRARTNEIKGLSTVYFNGLFTVIRKSRH